MQKWAQYNTNLLLSRAISLSWKQRSPGNELPILLLSFTKEISCGYTKPVIVLSCGTCWKYNGRSCKAFIYAEQEGRDPQGKQSRCPESLLLDYRQVLILCIIDCKMACSHWCFQCWNFWFWHTPLWDSSVSRSDTYTCHNLVQVFLLLDHSFG